MANNFATSIQGLLIDFLKPLEEAGSDPGKLTEWLATLGFGPGISSDPALTPIVQRAAALVAKVKALDAQTLQSWTGIASILSSGQDVATILQALRDFAADPARKDVTAGLAEELMSYLLASYLRRQHPTAFRVASLLTLIESRETAPVDPAIVTGGTTVRMARVLDRFKFGSVDDLITRPGATLEAFYFPNGLAAGADAWLSAERLFPNLGFLADLLGSSWRTEYRSDTAGSASTEGVIDPEESVVFDQDVSGDAPVPAPGPAAPDTFFASRRPTFSIKLAQEADLAIEISPSSHQHASAIAGLIVSLGGSFNHIETRGPWKLTFSASGEIPVLALGPDGVSRVPTGSPGTGGSTKLVIERIPDEGTSGAAFILGSPEGTRVEFGNLQAAFSLSADAQSADGSIDVAATSGMLCLAPSDGDGFLGSILPAAGLQAKFDLGLSWSGRRGLTLRGGAGLDTTVPVGFSIGGVSMPSVHLGLQAKDGSVSAEASASLSASIGPVRAVLDRLGIAGTLSFPQNGGNLGLADLQVGFKPPSGVGLSVEASGVLTGGGFLFHDEAQGIYAGVMQLSLHEQITLKAFGLIGTRMPDGSRGYSLVIFITAEDFRPVPLGMGFTLQGIGGMVAVHRTFDQNVLREGLKSDTLSALLFPRDPVGNAPAIIQALNSAFPARRGSYLLGLLARIGWFTPTLIQMDLALILEFGARERLLVLGRISSLLPSPDNDLVRLNLDAMGVLDFDEGTAAIDAVLVDSRLVHKFALTGAMALRARWTSGPGSGFVLAVGGFNPRFAPPAGVPPLARVAIALSSGNNPRLTCEAYFALTSNTVQFGARAQLYAEAYGFSLNGDVGFDVLFQIAPLHFIADFQASVQLKHGSSNLFKVSVQGELEGPRPLRVSGKASFEILWCDFSVRFDKTLIDGEQPPLPAAVDVLAELKNALSIAQSWSTLLPAQRTHGVALRSLAPSPALVLDPLGRLAVKQQVVPLNSGRDIDTYGGAPVAGARRFALAAAVNGKPLQQSEVLRADFAPAQFFAMSDDEKLASPSFEQMDAGLVFGSDAVSYDATQLVAAPLQYEAIVIDTALAARRAAARTAALHLAGAAPGAACTERCGGARPGAARGACALHGGQGTAGGESHRGALGHRAAGRRGGTRPGPQGAHLERVPRRAQHPQPRGRPMASGPRRRNQYLNYSVRNIMASAPNPTASLTFLPWVRQGVAAAIATVDTLGPQQPGVVDLTAGLTVNDSPTLPVSVRLRGPADVVGIDANQIVRLDPRPGTSDFEPTYFPCIEFDRADFPWLFTPASADGNSKLRPWLCLVVVRKQTGVTLGTAIDASLPVLQIAAPAQPSVELSDVRDAWAWVHAQAAGVDSADANVRAALEGSPQLSVSRLLCPRVLAANTDYIACVVPTFELGRKAGLGIPIKDTDVVATNALAPAWSFTPVPTQVVLPVYYHWEFRTGVGGDFATLVSVLRPHPAPAELGSRPIDISRPGFALPKPIPAGTTLAIEGALRAVRPLGSPDTMTPWSEDTAGPFQDALSAIVNAPGQNAILEPDADPLLAPPLYGRWHALRATVTKAGTDWFDQLNLDPRLRTAAAFGTSVIQENQEALMASAWDQAAELQKANQRMRQLQMSLAVSERLHIRHFSRLTDEATVRVGAPMLSRLRPAPDGAATGFTMMGQLGTTELPRQAISPAMRRIGRQRGPISRRVAAQGAHRSPTNTWVAALSAGTAPLPISTWFDATTVNQVCAWMNAPGAILSFAAVTGAFIHDFPHAHAAFNIAPEDQPVVVSPIIGLPPAADTRNPSAWAFRFAAAEHLKRVDPGRTSISALTRLQASMGDLHTALREGTQPKHTMLALVEEVVSTAPEVPPPTTPAAPDAGVDTIMIAPSFPQPMYESLRDLSQDLLLPGLEAVLPDSVLGLETNRRFVEAFMVGLNFEMARELLWRGFPTDQRGTYFEQFWGGGAGDIDPLHLWKDRVLGDPHSAPQREKFVMLVRSALLRRYPNAVVYLTPAQPQGTGQARKPSEDPADERLPMFACSMQPDIAFFGFDVTAEQATGEDGGAGYYVVIQEHPTEPRFGLHSGVSVGSASHVPVGTAAPANQPLNNLVWGRNSAHMAGIVRRLPVRLAIHASQFLPPTPASNPPRQPAATARPTHPEPVA